MILHSEDRQPLVPQSFQSLIVQVDVTRLDVGGQSRRIDGKTVVLSRDLDFAGLLVADRVVGAAMAELELEGLGAKRLSQELVAQANPEDRNAAGSAPSLINDRSIVVASARGRGSPGPFEMKIPSGSASRIASAGALPGMTVTLHPILTRWRRMFHFMPKSSATTRGR